MRVEEFVIVADYGSDVHLVCPDRAGACEWIPANGTIGSAIEAAQRHIDCRHPALTDSRALDREDGIHYAHLNGLDCGRRPCMVCAPTATPEEWPGD